MKGSHQTVTAKDSHGGGFKGALKLTGKWTGAWVLIGLALGLLFMFDKTPPFAESGGRPGDVWWYSFWVPIGGVLGLFGGVLGGALYAAVMAASRAFPDTAAALTDTRRCLACGAVTGALLCLTFVRDFVSLLIGAVLIALTVGTSYFVRPS